MVTPAKAAGNIRELCSLGVPAPTLLPDLLSALRKLVPADYCAHLWADDRGELCGGFIEQSGQDSHLQHYIDVFYNQREAEVTQGFTQAMWHAAPIRTEEENLTVPWRAFVNHDYYQQVMLPLGGLADCLKLVLRHHQRPLGTLLMVRTTRNSACRYTHQERQRIATVYPHLCHAFSRAHDYDDSDIMDHADTDPALLICDLNGAIHHLTAKARDLLYMLLNAHPSRYPGTRLSGQVPAALAPLLPRLHRIRDGLPTPPACLELPTAWGRLQAAAHWLDGVAPSAIAPLVAITLTRRVPLPLLWWRRLSGHGLSHRQLQVALLLMSGLPHTDIAARLGLGFTSVTSHARQVYLKMGVGSTQQLRSTLFTLKSD